MQTFFANFAGSLPAEALDSPDDPGDA